MTGAWDPYAVLGLRPGASLLEIARARRRLAKQFHPDVAPSAASDRMRAVNAAWEALSDPATRRAYTEASFRPPPTTWSRAAADPPLRPPGPTRHDAGTGIGIGGWVALGGVGLLLALILSFGFIAALDGPSMPGRNSPVLQNNLDRPGDP